MTDLILPTDMSRDSNIFLIIIAAVNSQAYKKLRLSGAEILASAYQVCVCGFVFGNAYVGYCVCDYVVRTGNCRA